MISLREHQVEANARIRAWAGFPTRSPVPAQGLRGTVVSATGSGKTITAAWAARECFRGGRILVMVPTLELLMQTAQAWRGGGQGRRVVSASSASLVDRGDPEDVTGRAKVRGPLEAALAGGERLYGQ